MKYKKKKTYHNYFRQSHQHNLFRRCRRVRVRCSLCHRKPGNRLGRLAHRYTATVSPCALCSWAYNFLRHLSSRMSAFQCRRTDRPGNESLVDPAYCCIQIWKETQAPKWKKKKRKLAKPQGKWCFLEIMRMLYVLNAVQEKYSSPSGQYVLGALFESDMITTTIIFVGICTQPFVHMFI